MRLRVILRLTPSENRKNRPEWYTKETCLRSVITAVDTAREAGLNVDFSIFLDVSSGRRLSPGIAALLTHADTIMPIRGGNAARSWRPVVRTVRDNVPYADEDLLYFIEDDYLHHPEALLALADGDAEYRLLYAHEQDHGAIGAEHNGWASTYGGTTSFAVTGAAFREDAARHLLLSHGGGAWDELSWRGLGSHVTPPNTSYVLWPFTAASKWPRKWGLRPLRHAVFRLIALTQARGRSRTIKLRLPIQATHSELALLAGETNWAELASHYTAEPPPPTPDHTIIIPTQNQRNQLEQTLTTTPQNPEPLNLLIIDEQSTDGTPELAHTHGATVLRLTAPTHPTLIHALAHTITQGKTTTLTQPGQPLPTPTTKTQQT